MAKIRKFFVSNSSSSSFCIAGYGIEVGSDNKIITQILNNKNMKLEDPYGEGTGFCAYNNYGDVEEWLHSIWLNNDRKYELGISEFGNKIYIVANPYELDENKSINEIKKDIRKDLQDLGFQEKDINIEFIAESY